MHSATGQRLDSSGGRLLLVGALGSLVALSLGIYGNAHDPASDLSITLGFKDTITMKVWLASLALAFACVQLGSALWLYGRLPVRAAPRWLGGLHRISGRLAFLSSLPVAYHCLYQLAFQDTSTRVLCTPCSAARSTARSRPRSSSSAPTRCPAPHCRSRAGWSSPCSSASG